MPNPKEIRQVIGKGDQIFATFGNLLKIIRDGKNGQHWRQPAPYTIRKYICKVRIQFFKENDLDIKNFVVQLLNWYFFDVFHGNIQGLKFLVHYNYQIINK